MTAITHDGALPHMEPHWEQLDLTPWRCPEPLVRLKLWLRDAQPGQSLQILLKDAGSRQDIPAWLLRQGHRVQLSQASGEYLCVQLVVGSSSP